jgi:lipoate-protein ligase B
MAGEIIAYRPRRLSYDEALQTQTTLRDECIASPDGPDHLLLVEHPPTITVGARGQTRDVLAPTALLAERGVCVRRTRRGGEVTFHGPGQLVVYPIIDLRRRGRNLRCYLRELEAWLVRLCRSYGVEAHSDSPHTGVWVADRKLASIGIACRRWVSYHGVALNVTTDLSCFDLIVPCGLAGVTMTSLQRELGAAPPLAQVAGRAAELFAEMFDMRLTWNTTRMPVAP